MSFICKISYISFSINLQFIFAVAVFFFFFTLLLLYSNYVLCKIHVCIGEETYNILINRFTSIFLEPFFYIKKNINTQNEALAAISTAYCICTETVLLC